jgi:hypothetical protein
MFFYLLYNSTILEKELDEYNRRIKVLIYGSIAYIILHAVLFIGGEEALLYSLKTYFWLFLILDFVVLGLMFNNKKNKNDNEKNVFEILFSKFSKNNNNQQIQSVNSVKNPILKQNNLRHRPNIRRRVHFNMNNRNESDSESDSDIGTDIDLSAFKASLSD